jgi:hypothetical protein
LRCRLIAPEVRGADVLLDVGELLLETGCLKDASAIRRRGGSIRRNVVRDRRDQQPQKSPGNPAEAGLHEGQSG